jgi:DNA-binding PadR family transcriptional regulator
MSGYDIKQFLDRLVWLVGSPSFGAIYPALHALLRDELVSVETQTCDSKPPRKIYTITETGESALDEWLHQPLVSGASTRAFVMRLILVSRLSHDALAALLRQRRNQVAEQYATLNPLTREPSGTADRSQYLASDYGLAIASAELAWLDGLLETLSGRPLAEGAWASQPMTEETGKGQ